MLQTSDSIISYAGNNSTVTPYVVPFRFFDAPDLVVVVKDELNVETVQSLGADYSVTGANNPTGGNVLFTWAVPATSLVVISRSIEATQLTSYEEADAFPAKSHERALDKLTMICQQLSRGMGTGTGNADDLGAAFRVTEASGGINAVSKIPDSMLGVDAMGNSILRTANEMLGWLGQVATVWENDAERVVTRGAYDGQLGVQLDNYTIYVARSTDPGAWIAYFDGTGVVYSEDGTPVIHPAPAGSLVGTLEAQVLLNKTLIAPTIMNPTGMDAEDVGLGSVDNTSDANKPISSATQIALDGKQSLAQKATANGYPSLDSSGKIPVGQLPDAVVGASQYQGAWNAATNTPTIPAASIGNKGWYYQVSVAGTTTINGISSWAVGDSIISNGMVWEKIPNYSAVVSVNAKTGVVVVNKADVGLGNVDNTSDATKNSATATLTNKTIAGANNTLTVRLDADVVNNLPVTRLNNATGAGPGTWWCGDGSWKAPPGGGDVTGQPISADGEITLFSGATGKAIKRATGSGLVNVASGVYQSPIPVSSLSLVPAGCVMDYMGPTEPAGWLFCHGQPKSQATYPNLFSMLGVNYVQLPPRFVSEQGYGEIEAAFTSPTTVEDVVVTGENRLLLVWIIYYNDSFLPTIATVKFGGVNLTRHHTDTFYNTTGAMDLWYLVAPAVSTADVVVTSNISASGGRQICVSAQLYNDVNQTTPLGAAVSYPTYASIAENAVAVPFTDNDLVVDGLSYYYDGAHMAGTGQVEVSVRSPGPGYFGIRSSNKVGPTRPVAQYDSATICDMRWWMAASQPSTLIAVALKPVGPASGMFYLPDCRGRVTVGRDNMGGIVSGRMSPIIAFADTQGTGAGYEYLYNMTRSPLYLTMFPQHTIQTGMRVTGPGIPPDTFVNQWYNESVLSITKAPTEIVRNGRYSFAFADTTALGAVLGKSAHCINEGELTNHSHLYFALSGQAGPNVPGGSGWGFTTAGTYGAGGNSDHNNIQPSFITNKIIKY